MAEMIYLPFHFSRCVGCAALSCAECTQSGCGSRGAAFRHPLRQNCLSHTEREREKYGERLRGSRPLIFFICRLIDDAAFPLATFRPNRTHISAHSASGSNGKLPAQRSGRKGIIFGANEEENSIRSQTPRIRSHIHHFRVITT